MNQDGSEEPPRDDVDRAALKNSETDNALTDAGYMSDVDKISEGVRSPQRSRCNTRETLEDRSTLTLRQMSNSTERCEYFSVVSTECIKADGGIIVDISELSSPDTNGIDYSPDDIHRQLNPSFHPYRSGFLESNDDIHDDVSSANRELLFGGELVGATSQDYDIEPGQWRERRGSISRHSQTSPTSDDERMEAYRYKDRRITPIWRSSFDASERSTPPGSPIAFSLDEPPPNWNPEEKAKATRYRRKRKMSSHLNSFRKFTDTQIILMTAAAGLLKDRLAGDNAQSLLRGLNATIRNSQFDIRQFPNNAFARSHCEMCEENVEVPPELRSDDSIDTESGHLCRHKVVLLKEVGSLLRSVCKECGGFGAVWDEMAVNMGVGDRREAIVIDASPDNTHRTLDTVGCIPRDLDESIDFLRDEVRDKTIRNVSDHQLFVLRRRLFDCLLMRAARQRRLKSALSGVWCIAYNVIFQFVPLTIKR